MSRTCRKPKILSLPMLVGLCVMSSAEAASSAGSQVLKDADQFAGTQAESLRPYFKALYIEGEHNAVLNFDYLGLAALEQGDYVTAEKAFDGAIARIESIYADNPNAKKAKSIFAEEKVKDFKGEPYERAMTYFYRGLLYVRSGDYQNARASFLSAEQQSMMSEKESYDSTFGLMDYMAGWSSYCDGDEGRAADLQARATKLQPQVFSGLSDSVGFVGLVDLGKGPIKYGVGKYHEKLAFKPAEPLPTLSSVQVNSTSLTPVLGADLNWQATTRGGRPVDAILNGKAEWKSTTEGASTALTAAGYAATLQGAVSNNSSLQQAGEIGMAVGLIGGLFASAMTPAADTRSWTNLPAGIAVVTASPQPAALPPEMTFAVGGAQTEPAALKSRSGKCALSWGRSQASVDAALAQVAKPSLAEGKHEGVNEQFRTTLHSTFAGVQSASTTASATVAVTGPSR
jgi:tetratricopeptide (TPR) repeat protein